MAESSESSTGQSGVGQQQEMPFALVQGQPMTQLPLDLYIPPDALEIILEQFEGPLDLLLYLIRKQNLDILSVNVSDIVDQYMAYIDAMQALQLELAGEYLVMASMLMEIKSRAVLPRNQSEDDEDGEDPKAELIRRLLEYEQFKLAAEDLDGLPRLERDTTPASVEVQRTAQRKIHPPVNMTELMIAMADVLRRSERFEQHEVTPELLSTRERMSAILDQLEPGIFLGFKELLLSGEGRGGVVVTFLAMLELVKESLLELVQQDPFGPIHIRLAQSGVSDSEDIWEQADSGDTNEPN